MTKTRVGVVLVILLLVLLVCRGAMGPTVLRLSASRSGPLVTFRLTKLGIGTLTHVSFWDQSRQYLWAVDFLGQGAKLRSVKLPYGTLPAGMSQVFPDSCMRPRPLVSGDTVFALVDYNCDFVFPAHWMRGFAFAVRDDDIVRIRVDATGRFPKNYPIDGGGKSVSNPRMCQ